MVSVEDAGSSVEKNLSDMKVHGMQACPDHLSLICYIFPQQIWFSLCDQALQILLHLFLPFRTLYI